jgi:hypothetical protein
LRADEVAAAGALEALCAVLELGGQDGPSAAGEPVGALAAAGPRASSDPAAYTFVLESVLEGYLLHYGQPRLTGVEGSDLRLLAGDLAYALGLARLAELGDLEAVSELGDLISLCAQVHSEGRAGHDSGADSLVAGLWALTALAVGTGSWAGHGRVKESVRSGAPGATAEALAEARARAARAGVGDELNSALIAFTTMLRAAPRTT